MAASHAAAHQAAAVMPCCSALTRALCCRHTSCSTPPGATHPGVLDDGVQGKADPTKRPQLQPHRVIMAGQLLPPCSESKAACISSLYCAFIALCRGRVDEGEWLVESRTAPFTAILSLPMASHLAACPWPCPAAPPAHGCVTARPPIQQPYTGQQRCSTSNHPGVLVVCQVLGCNDSAFHSPSSSEYTCTGCAITWPMTSNLCGCTEIAP